MLEFPSYKKQKFTHKDLNPIRKVENENDVNAIIEILSDKFFSTFLDNLCLCINESKK